MEVDRYHRQRLLPQIGDAGQQRLAESRVAVIGCGALGTVIVEQLARAGVGWLRVVDRDVVELTNLQRQTLFTEADVRDALPKAVAAKARLAEVNSAIAMDAVVADVHSGNIEQFLFTEGKPIDLILDGTDNVQTRYLINDAALKHSIPWVYGACVGMQGRVMPIVPGEGPCLRCVFPNPPEPGELDTCDTAGVLGPAAALVASLQSTLALQILLHDCGTPQLMSLDAWAGRFHATSLQDARRADCPTCGARRFEFLSRTDRTAVSLCGRNAVQIRPTNGTVLLDMPRLEHKLAAVGEVHRTQHLVRCRLRDEDPASLTVFLDGRAIVHGTNDLNRAKSLYAKYVGA